VNDINALPNIKYFYEQTFFQDDKSFNLTGIQNSEGKPQPPLPLDKEETSVKFLFQISNHQSLENQQLLSKVRLFAHY
jgi:hypothetical protein